MTFERRGVLEGEYALICDGNLLVARDGTIIRAASAWEEPFSTRNIDELRATTEFTTAIHNILLAWDRTPLVESPAILSGILLENYFHFSLEITPRLRHVPAATREKVVIGDRALRLPFQTSLLARAGAGCTFIRAPEVLRVRDPVVSHDALSEDGVRWLRRFGLRAKRGDRRLYIRRGSRSGRTQAGGGLEETPEILELLKAFDFEIVDFGHGDTVEAQAAKLDGVGFILATHGAALTNLAYVEEGVCVLEIIGANSPRAVYMHLSDILKLNYRAILTDSFSESGDILLDAATLRDGILSLA
jgi:capsular polysaccharide biosynthesis protein